MLGTREVRIPCPETSYCAPLVTLCMSPEAVMWWSSLHNYKNIIISVVVSWQGREDWLMLQLSFCKCGRICSRDYLFCCCLVLESGRVCMHMRTTPSYENRIVLITKPSRSGELLMKISKQCLCKPDKANIAMSSKTPPATNSSQTAAGICTVFPFLLRTISQICTLT